MNFVFWFIIVLLLIVLWIVLSAAFKGIGGLTERIKKYVSKNLEDEKEKKR